jgi:hypothetical protein
MYNVEPTTDIAVEAEKENNVPLWVTLRKLHSRNGGMEWRARDLGVNKGTSKAKFDEKFLAEYFSLKSYLTGLKACGMTPNRHKEKSKTENTFRKRVTQWEPLSLCYLRMHSYPPPHRNPVFSLFFTKRNLSYFFVGSC